MAVLLSFVQAVLLVTHVDLCPVWSSLVTNVSTTLEEVACRRQPFASMQMVGSPDVGVVFLQTLRVTTSNKKQEV